MNLENVYYRNSEGEIQYNPTCEECSRKCKQSFRTFIMVCERTKELKKRRK